MEYTSRIHQSSHQDDGVQNISEGCVGRHSQICGYDELNFRFLKRVNENSVTVPALLQRNQKREKQQKEMMTNVTSSLSSRFGRKLRMLKIQKIRIYKIIIVETALYLRVEAEKTKINFIFSKEQKRRVKTRNVIFRCGLLIRTIEEAGATSTSTPQ